jgi:hypothetical protein
MFEGLKAVIDLPIELWNQDKKALAIGVIVIYILIIVTLLWMLIDFLSSRPAYVPETNISQPPVQNESVGLPF